MSEGQDRGGTGGAGGTARADARGSDAVVDAVWRALETVTDPEVPVLSVVDMGIIADVRVQGDDVIVDLTPTFTGCPALDVIRADIVTAAAAATQRDVTVNVVYDPPWTSDRLSENGRRKLKAFGVAPPGPSACGGASMPNLEQTPCPHCDSTETDLESLFGPTLCRSIHYCRSCLQSFEHFKTV